MECIRIPLISTTHISHHNKGKKNIYVS